MNIARWRAFAAFAWIQQHFSDACERFRTSLNLHGIWNLIDDAQNIFFVESYLHVNGIRNRIDDLEMQSLQIEFWNIRIDPMRSAMILVSYVQHP